MFLSKGDNFLEYVHLHLGIVALNSDACVRRLKGPSRPVMLEQDRACVIDALRFVDYVIIFDDDVASKLVEEIAPDCYAKGSIMKDAFPEKEIADRLGVEIVFIPSSKEYSTTNIISTIKALPES